MRDGRGEVAVIVCRDIGARRSWVDEVALVRVWWLKPDRFRHLLTKPKSPKSA
jgi:hypothetical protein